ncbi:MAG: DUF4251 domain-containing protein [Bacteroidales bacterium]
MKKLIFMILPLLLMSCSSSYNSTTKQAVKAATKSEVERMLASVDYKINVYTAYPTGGKLVNLGGGYSFTVRNDSAFSYMPYFGRVFSAPMGNSESGIKFKEKIQDYVVTRTKKGMYKVKMHVNSKYDSYTINMDISPDGSSSVRVNSHEKNQIMFMGNMEMQMPK